MCQKEGGQKRHYAVAVWPLRLTIAVMVILSISLSFIQEHRSNNAADKLQRMVSITATVRRQVRVETHDHVEVPIELRGQESAKRGQVRCDRSARRCSPNEPARNPTSKRAHRQTTIKRKQGFSEFLKFRSHVQLILF